MRLVIDGTVADGAQRLAVHADAGAGDWVVVAHPAPDAVVAAVGGVGPGDLTITLGDTDVGALSAARRHQAKLCVTGCRLDPLPALRVADVVGLGVRAPQPPLWQALVGTARSRALSKDDEAMVRALAGRVGLARWVDRTAVNLPLKVEALVDITRALAGQPLALVWRRPEWLDAGSLAELNDVITAEQQLAGFTVVEFAQGRPGTLPPP